MRKNKLPFLVPSAREGWARDNGFIHERTVDDDEIALGLKDVTLLSVVQDLIRESKKRAPRKDVQVIPQVIEPKDHKEPSRPKKRVPRVIPASQEASGMSQPDGTTKE